MKQPKIKKGKEFTGWATFNWGLCHHAVFRTRKEAMDFCINRSNGETWNDIKDHFRVEKVKCKVV
jgi:hypothetical protein